MAVFFMFINQYPQSTSSQIQTSTLQVHLVCGDVGAKLGEPRVVEAREQRINTLLLSSGIARFNPTIAHYIQMDAYCLCFLSSLQYGRNSPYLPMFWICPFTTFFPNIFTEWYSYPQKLFLQQ